jgi:hypothetical protein
MQPMRNATNEECNQWGFIHRMYGDVLRDIVEYRMMILLLMSDVSEIWYTPTFTIYIKGIHD